MLHEYATYIILNSHVSPWHA